MNIPIILSQEQFDRAVMILQKDNSATDLVNEFVNALHRARDLEDVYESLKKRN